MIQLVCDSLVEKCLKMHREERCLDSKVRTCGSTSLGQLVCIVCVCVHVCDRSG